MTSERLKSYFNSIRGDISQLSDHAKKKEDEAIDDRIKQIEEVYSRRQVLDLSIIFGIVIVGGLWDNAIEQFLKQKVFKDDEPSWWKWLLTAVIGFVVLVVLFRFLKLPFFLFA